MKLLGIGLLSVAGIGIGLIVAIKIATTLSASTGSDKQAVVVTIDDDGFRPAEITVPLGTPILWSNNDYQPHRVISGPFGVNSDLPELNSQQSVGHGGTYEYIPTKKGTFSYYDADSPTLHGKITIQ